MISVEYQDFLRQLETQRVEYAKSLQSRVAGIDMLWRAMRDGSAARGDSSTLVRAAHSLAGSGAVFGFDELSEEARLLEERLQRVHTCGSTRADVDAIERLIVSAGALARKGSIS